MKRLIPVAFLLLPLAAGGCGVDRTCPMHVTEGGISVDASAFVAAHPGVTKICADEGLCVVPAAGQPASVLIPVNGPGTETIEVTITGAGDKELLSSRVKVSVKAAKKVHGCSSGAAIGLVKVGADGRLTAS